MSIGELRDSITGFLYRNIFKKIAFALDPEEVHDRVTYLGRFLGSNFVTRSIVTAVFGYQNSKLEQSILGIKFKNPIGLAAGFDKDGYLRNILPSVGFGFMEAGSITAKPYKGNQQPRLYRLPEYRALRINYGLKSLGAEAVHQNLMGRKFVFPIGISLAKTNIQETSQVTPGVEDYFFTYQIFQDLGDYFTINISCPNTSEESPIFAQSKNLGLLLEKIFSFPKQKPIFVKLSPDMEDVELESILDVCQKYGIDGFVCSNLTKVNKFEHQGKGGFSGKPVFEASNRLIATVYKLTQGKKIIIGCGGVFSAEDAYKKIRLGASLVQLITGMIYKGPQLIGQINRGLVKLLERDGLRSISDAVGIENKLT